MPMTQTKRRRPLIIYDDDPLDETYSKQQPGQQQSQQLVLQATEISTPISCTLTTTRLVVVPKKRKRSINRSSTPRRSRTKGPAESNSCSSTAIGSRHKKQLKTDQPASPPTCSISLDVIPEGRQKRMRVANHFQVYDIEYLLSAIEADPLVRDPCTRQPYTPAQITGIRKAAMSAGLCVTPTTILKTIHKIHAKLNDLVMTVTYNQWSDIASDLDSAMNDITWFLKSPWMSVYLRCVIAEQWTEDEEVRWSRKVVQRSMLAELLQQQHQQDSDNDDFQAAVVDLFSADHSAGRSVLT